MNGQPGCALHQSVHLRQKLEDIGIDTDLLSCDRTDEVPVTAKMAITENRVTYPYDRRLCNEAKYLKYINTKSSSERFFENEKNSKQPLPHIHEYNDKKGKILVIPILLNERRKGLLLLSVIDAITDNFENNINLIKSALKVTMLKFESLMYKYKSTNSILNSNFLSSLIINIRSENKFSLFSSCLNVK